MGDVDSIEKEIVYANNEEVVFYFGLNGQKKGTGRVRGRSRDGWIIEVTDCVDIDKTMYPWPCIWSPHTWMRRLAPDESREDFSR
jgi:hypothetical protein